MATSSDVNVEAFNAMLPKLLTEHAGKFVLLSDGKRLGIYPSYEEAVEAGIERCQFDQFFVEAILPAEQLAGAQRLVAL
jgi:hypothetical protein